MNFSHFRFDFSLSEGRFERNESLKFVLWFWAKNLIIVMLGYVYPQFKNGFGVLV